MIALTIEPIQLSPASIESPLCWLAACVGIAIERFGSVPARRHPGCVLAAVAAPAAGGRRCGVVAGEAVEPAGDETEVRAPARDGAVLERPVGDCEPAGERGEIRNRRRRVLLIAPVVRR